MSKLPIWIDMDEVICDFLGKLLIVYNQIYNKNIKISDIKKWSLKQYIGKEGIELFKQPGFFADLQPIQNSLEIINKLLKEDKEIFIISSPTNEHCVFDKYQWIKNNLPSFPIGNLVLVGNKGDLLTKIDDGILFDDNVDYLMKFKGISVCMDMPYNQGVKCKYKIFNNDWNKFYEIISKERR